MPIDRQGPYKYLPCPFTEPEKRLVKIFELIKIEKHVINRAVWQWLGRPIQEREAIARSFVVKAVMKYQHTRSLRHELQSTPNLRAIYGFARRKDVPSEATFSRAFTGLPRLVWKHWSRMPWLKNT